MYNGLTKVTIRPALRAPKIHSANSGILGRSIAIVSPGFNPQSVSKA